MIQKSPWNVLLIEANDADRRTIQSLFSNISTGQTISLDWISDWQTAVQAAQLKRYDAVLVGGDPADARCLEVIRDLVTLEVWTPVIVLTSDERANGFAQAIQKAGAADCLVKTELATPLLIRSIQYAIERVRLEEALVAAKEELAVLIGRTEKQAESAPEQNLRSGTISPARSEESRLAGKELTEVRWRLIDRMENERLDLARELHDGPMQDLYSMIYALPLLLDEVDRPKAIQLIEGLQKQAQEIVRSLRAIAGELRPPSLTPFGLEPAIRAHAHASCEAHPQIRLHLEIQPNLAKLPERVNLALFRIYQAAINNSLRHAGATQITIRLKQEGSLILLDVEDNGCGFEVPESWYEFAVGGHLGLAGATERARTVGGRLDVLSRAGQGTTIRVLVPLDIPSSDQQTEMGDPIG